jgi:hypothetical protein
MSEEPTSSAYQFKQHGLGYVVTFPSDQVQVTVDQLRRSSGELRGEVTVESTLPGIPPHLHWGSLILSSTANREKLASTLQKRTQGLGIDWDNILEIVCRRIALAQRTGEEFVTAGDLPDEEEEEETAYIVKDFVPKLETATVFGDGGVGKSMLALALLLSVVTGDEIVPGYPPLETGAGLYLDFETSRKRIDKRAKLLCRGVGIAPVAFGYRRCSVPLVDQVEEVLRYIQSEGVKILVVDSVEMAMAGTGGEGGDPNDKVIRLHSALRMLKTSTILVDHISAAGKYQTGGAGKAIGGVFKSNLARMAYELRKAKDSSDGHLHIGLYNTKRNDDGLPFRPVGLRVEFDADARTATYHREGISDPDLAAGLSVTERIKLVLRNSPMEQKDLVQEVDATAGAVRTALSRGNGTAFTKLGDGRWALLAEPASQPEAAEEMPW